MAKRYPDISKEDRKALRSFDVPDPEVSAVVAPKGMTGIALTTETSSAAGFSNFRVCTLFIVNGEIVHTEKSQEFVLFEAIARAEIILDRALWHLSNKYKPGMFLTLGSEDREKLVNRLRIDNPDLLDRIAPALGIEL